MVDFENWICRFKKDFELSDSIPISSKKIIERVADSYKLTYSVHFTGSTEIHFTENNDFLNMEVHIPFSHQNVSAPSDFVLNYILLAGLGYALLKLDFKNSFNNDGWKTHLSNLQKSPTYIMGNHNNNYLAAYFAQSLLMPVKNFVPYAMHHTIPANKITLFNCPKINQFDRFDVESIMNYFKVTPSAVISRIDYWKDLKKYYNDSFKN